MTSVTSAISPNKFFFTCFKICLYQILNPFIVTSHEALKDCTAVLKDKVFCLSLGHRLSATAQVTLDLFR